MNPLSSLFGAGVGLRNALYDRGILKIHRLSRPVVSIGNISVGGSGKTPFVIALGELLKQRGIAFDVLSRGYGRNSHDLAVVDAGGSPAQFGDEPLLIARALHAPVIVGPDRYQAGLLAESRFSSRIHLLDDGFQHRRLHRDFDIVMLPASDLEDTLLPVGRLREPVSALRRADVVVHGAETAVPGWVKSEWRVRREIRLDPPFQPGVAFCGLARPAQFFAGVRELAQGNLVATVAFPDHHRYSQRDIERLLAAKTAGRAECFITTEKDQMNLGDLAARLQPLKIARLKMVLETPDRALDCLLETLERRCSCRF